MPRISGKGLTITMGDEVVIPEDAWEIVYQRFDMGKNGVLWPWTRNRKTGEIKPLDVKAGGTFYGTI